MSTDDVQAPLVLGLLNIGPIELAIPTCSLREAVAHPAQLSPLLSASPHVAGAIDVRGDLVPVLDLRHALSLTPANGATGRIVIVSHKSHLFGIAVDALGSVITLPRAKTQDVEVMQPQSAPLLDQLFSLDEGARVINLLSLDGVCGLFDLPLARVRQAGEASVQRAEGAKHWSPYVLFECGDVRLAIDAHVVETVIDIGGLDGGIAPSEGCLGLIQSGERRMAVVDALDILGLGCTDLQNNKQVLVLKSEGNRVGVLIRRVSQIARLNDATRRPVPSMAFSSPELFEGMLPFEEQGDFLCVAKVPFLAMPEVSSMASIHGRPIQNKTGQTQPGERHVGGRKPRSDVHLTFRIGQELAAPLKEVREILPLPKQMTPIRRDGDPRIGVFTHRRASVPIIDLAVLLGVERAPISGETRLLLVDGEDGTVALLVERVNAIEAVQWEHEAISQSLWRNAEELDAALHLRRLLTLGEGAAKRGVAALDLPRIARAIEARYASSATLETERSAAQEAKPAESAIA